MFAPADACYIERALCGERGPANTDTSTSRTGWGNRFVEHVPAQGIHMCINLSLFAAFVVFVRLLCFLFG